MQTKTCRRCGVEKPLDAFSRQAQGRFGRTSACKVCESERARAVRDRWAAEVPLADASKVCPRCKRDLPLADYPRGRSNRLGVATYCRECSAAIRRAKYDADPARWKQKSRDWELANPEKTAERRRRNWLRNAYGISLEQYASLLSEQGERCAVCGTTEPGGNRGRHYIAFCVDHSHDNGAVRGLLCHPCNSGIGLLGDDPERLAAAIEYLRRH